jgi:hypothetical protein
MFLSSSRGSYLQLPDGAVDFGNRDIFLPNGRGIPGSVFEIPSSSTQVRQSVQIVGVLAA